jgi:hypothetical protein
MNNNLDETVQAVKQLVALFKTERLVYLIITLISLIVLVVAAIILINQNKDNSEQLIATIGLLTSSGGMIYSSGRLLKMWSDAMQLIQKSIESKNG